MMDYHRCIGCRFCMAACPYGARSMNYRDPRPFIGKINPDFPTRTKGVVEKCNFCEERLSRGVLPACVLACKEKALLFGDLEAPGSNVRRLLEGRLSLRRRPELGTGPQVYYLL
jgi:molybdopterin-containing oxidoreductase family iron-sulfur binding subunit